MKALKFSKNLIPKILSDRKTTIKEAKEIKKNNKINWLRAIFDIVYKIASLATIIALLFAVIIYNVEKNTEEEVRKENKRKK